MICPRKPKKPCPHMSMFDFRCEYSENGKVCILDPTPAELAQQLADLTGQTITVWQGRTDRWWFSNANLMDCLEIKTRVNYTGRWQDSKVTATPQAVDGKVE
jgi:hypothetical protein